LYAACDSPVLALEHLGITEFSDLLAWAVVLLCVTTALLRDRPRSWLVAGLAAGIGLETSNLMLLLLICLAAGILCSGPKRGLGTRWPWPRPRPPPVVLGPNPLRPAPHRGPPA